MVFNALTDTDESQIQSLICLQPTDWNQKLKKIKSQMTAVKLQGNLELEF